MENKQLTLLSEQMTHAFDLMRVDMERLQTHFDHQSELTNNRLDRIEEMIADHETRLRQAGEGVSQFKVWTGMVSGGAGLAALTALVKSFLGGL